MTPDERRQRLQLILDRHNQAARELRESIEHRRGIVARTDDLAEATAKAIDAMIAANEAAMALWNEKDSDE